MIIRRAGDHRIMPWANGRGQTVELLREDGPDGLLLRLSIATVNEDGAFSHFPGIDRVLTVISGPGFRLAGSGLHLHAAPLIPVAFPGDVAIAATDVIAPSDDFNVMTARRLPKPRVWVTNGGVLVPEGRLFVLVLAGAVALGQRLEARDLIAHQGRLTIQSDGPLLAVDLLA